MFVLTRKVTTTLTNLKITIMTTLNAIQKLVKAYGLTESFETAASKIKEGAKFNGTVYSKKDGKHRMCLSVYIDGTYIHLGSVENEDVSKFKNVFVGAKITTTTASDYGTIGWWVNGMVGE